LEFDINYLKARGLLGRREGFLGDVRNESRKAELLGKYYE